MGSAEYQEQVKKWDAKMRSANKAHSELVATVLSQADTIESLERAYQEQARELRRVSDRCHMLWEHLSTEAKKALNEAPVQ